MQCTFIDPMNLDFVVPLICVHEARHLVPNVPCTSWSIRGIGHCFSLELRALIITVFPSQTILLKAHVKGSEVVPYVLLMSVFETFFYPLFLSCWS